VEWIIDGMNLIGSVADGWWRDRAGARLRLIADLGALVTRGDAVAVVFDGRLDEAAAAAGAAANVDVSFAPGGPNAADDVIASMCAALPLPDAVTVVTSDAGLAARVRASGVAVVGVTAFRSVLKATH
jgi:predicted RNA-binding protein with PIN domain